MNSQAEYVANVLALVIKEARMRKGLSQTEFAEASHCSRATVSKVENGHSNTKILTITRMAGVLGIRLSELFDLVEEIADAEVARDEALKSLKGRLDGHNVRGRLWR